MMMQVMRLDGWMVVRIQGSRANGLEIRTGQEGRKENICITITSSIGVCLRASIHGKLPSSIPPNGIHKQILNSNGQSKFNSSYQSKSDSLVVVFSPSFLLFILSSPLKVDFSTTIYSWSGWFNCTQWFALFAIEYMIHTATPYSEWHYDGHFDERLLQQTLSTSPCWRW